ncbi:MAG: restriction endonuclease subunit S [Pirellula sp.]|nr:restriction endonuclease subunit S [Pirellula sp.]
MGVKPGYKHTEVGVIPEDWEADNLGRFWGVTDCKHVTAQFVPQGFPLASIREVQSRFVELTNAKQTTAHFYNLLIEGGRKPCPGDLILSRNATVGEVAQVTEWHPPFAMGQDVCLLRKKSNEHSTEFLQSIFQSPVILKQLADLMVGSTFKRVNVQQIRNFAVPMPPPPEQRVIAEALSDVDGLLGGLDRLIAKKRDLKQAAMQQILTGQTRLPGFHGEWEVKKLGDVAEVKTGPFGSTLHESDYARDGTPIITVEHLGEFGVEQPFPNKSPSPRYLLR